MSETEPRLRLDDVEQPCCEICGCRIDEPDQERLLVG